MSGTIKLQGAQVEWLLRGALAAASRDDVTPVLTAVEWVVTADRVTVTSTDRYRVHQLHVKGDFTGNEGTFLMSGEQARLLLKSWHTPRRLYGDQVVDLSWVDAEPLPEAKRGKKIARRYHGTITFTIYAWDGDEADRITHEGSQVRGNFPPVGRLFPDEVDLAEGETSVRSAALNPAFLADTRWLRSGHGSLRFVMPKADAATRLSPVLVVNTEGTARGLIQPFLIGSDWKKYGDA